jgi:large subunit ribosomal protein L30
MAETTKPGVNYLKITQIKSGIGYSKQHKATLKALGFHHLHETLVKEDNAPLRGMLALVSFLVVIEKA